MKKTIKWIILGLFLVIVIVVLCGAYLFYSSLPKTKGEIALKGISEEVEIIRDKWGVPHIYAQNEKDLFFACGYVHAQDRLWQMELMRRAGSGRLSEIFGEVTVETDKLLRVLGLKKAAEKDLAKLSPKMKKLLTAYKDGVNAYINSKKPLPPEFLILRYKPDPWEIIDSLLIKEIMAYDLCVNFNSEILRAELIDKLREEKTNEIMPSYPEEGAVIVPYLGKKREKSWESKDVTLEFIPTMSVRQAPALQRFFVKSGKGSNSWVVDGTITRTGKPLLANDPHLGIRLPSIWYEIHLIGGNFNVVGVSLTGIPFVIIGHNEHIAWGLTNSYADVQDLYIEKLNSKQDKYLYNGEWKKLRIFEEEIFIKGKKEPEKIKIKWTRRGPIITPIVVKSSNPIHGEFAESISLKWVIYEGGQVAETFYLINKAKNWDEFKAGVSLFDAPSQNFIYADRKGNIGYFLSGKIPLRKNHKGLIPVPGETDKYEWIGYLEEDEKPFSFNPPEHFIVTANNKIVSDDYPYYISKDYLAPFRANRIRELLLKKEKHSIDSFKEIQLDVFSNQAQIFLPLIRELEDLSGEAKKAQDILKNWDGEMTEGKEPALFQVFLQFFNENTFRDELGDSLEKFKIRTDERWAGLLRIIDNSQSQWFENINNEKVMSVNKSGENKKKIIEKSLNDAYLWLSEKYGAPENWNWTEMHAIYFQHALGQVAILKFFNRGPYPVMGDGETVNNSDFSINNPYRTVVAASFRQIVDLADLKNSICVGSSGQSGHFLSPHYDDQIKLWLNGKYYPMLFYREDIENQAEGKLTLIPIGQN
ncbi:MAG: penicillin acylase family protein [Candidatus Aminicenantia bacterium]